MSKTFKGIHVPTITPYTPDGDVSEELIRYLIDFYIDAGVCCIVPTADNGEQPFLTVEERKRIWTTTIESAANRVCVAASITGNTTKEVVQLAKLAESLGSDGVMLAPPYYFEASEDELYEHYSTVAESINIPLIIHNEPSVFKSDIRPEFVAKLNKVENISLIKECTEDTQRIHEIIRLCGDNMTVIVAGGGTALESFLLGARAWMTGLVNFAPQASVAMYRLAAQERRFDDARKIYFDTILPIYSCIKTIGKPVPTVKYALSLVLGRSVGLARRPLHPLTESEKGMVKDVLLKTGIIAG